MKIVRRARRLRYRIWWAWAKFRLGSDVLIAAGYAPPRKRRREPSGERGAPAPTES